MIAGCEAAWAFFGGVFKVIIPDNMSAVVDRAHPLEPRFNRAFAEYAQDRGFLIDPARVRSPDGQAPGRADRAVRARQLLRRRGRSSAWPTRSAGPRPGAPGGPGSGSTGTTQCRPAELFAARGGTAAAARPGLAL